MEINREGVNIGFEQLTYKVKTGIFRRSKKKLLNQVNEYKNITHIHGLAADKKILDGISGNFRAGELSVIIGPSGSGKTTLLNILSGVVQHNFGGTLHVDGSTYKVIRNKSAYIMQDKIMHPLLTVREAMSFAIRFKTGKLMTLVQQKCKCDAILKQLGLLLSADTLTENLSGGQRKRLSIAVELVSDPSILFLDEPTTGLDSFASSQFVTYLSNLGKTGKTIICSIHAPSARMFETFDHVYAIAEGKCIYQGSSSNIVPFLSELNISEIKCPASYNPADFLMEIATNQYGHFNQTLSDRTGNSNEVYRNDSNLEKSSERGTTKTQDLQYESTFTYQLFLLLQRNFLLMRRNKDYMFIRFVACAIIGVIVGVSFYDVGHLANHVLDNYKYIYSTTQYLTYSSFFSLLVRFPIDLPILRSEHFNRWYSSLSYYLALTISDVPVLLGVTFLYTLISYYMTGQPMEQHRLLLILFIGILLSSTAQAFGLFASSISSNITITLVIGTGLMAVHMMFSGVLVLKKDVQPWLKWIFDINFLNHANEGMTMALFGYNRGKLECTDIYCHFKDPKDFLKLIDAPTAVSIYSFFVICFIVHVFTFIIVMIKLNRIN